MTFYKPILLLFIPLLLSQFLSAQILDTNDFVTRWKTNVFGSSGDSSININIDPVYTYKYDVDWNNDGIFDDTAITTSIIHTFSDTGIYKIRIRGQFPKIEFGRSGDSEKIISIDQWGNSKWLTMYQAFNGCFNLRYNASDIPDLSSVTNLSFMFSWCTAFNGAIGNWDVSTITDMSYMFSMAQSFNQPIGSWDVSKVTNMRAMFLDAINFNQFIGNWDVSSVEIMDRMFRGSDLNVVYNLHPHTFNQDISNWVVSNVIDFSEMFSHNDSFNVDISTWDVSSSLSMAEMFEKAISFNQDISNWDVDSVSYFYEMFKNNPVFNQDIGKWDVSSATQTRSMFENATAFNQDISNWHISKVSTTSKMFKGASAFDQNLGLWDISQLRFISEMFANSGLSILNYDSTLIAWESKSHKYNVRFLPTGLEYCQSDSVRSILISEGWDFRGDQKNCQTVDLKKESQISHLKIYPNPTQGEVVFITNPNNDQVTFNLSNSLGQNLNSGEFKNKNFQLHLAENSGIYYLQLKTNQNTNVFKIIKY